MLVLIEINILIESILLRFQMEIQKSHFEERLLASAFLNLVNTNNLPRYEITKKKRLIYTRLLVVLDELENKFQDMV